MAFLLCACEESQAVCSAFRFFGVEAFSCDLQDCSGGHPEWHIKGDALCLLKDNVTFTTVDGTTHFVPFWDMLIAFPPCTYVSKAGSTHLFPGGVLNVSRYEKGLAARSFFDCFYNAPVSRIVIENPVPNLIFQFPPWTQIVQPYYFGDPYSKCTCLWEKNVPILMATDIVVPEYDFLEYFDLKMVELGLSGRSARQKLRSVFPKGLSFAMAAQWSPLLLK